MNLFLSNALKAARDEDFLKDIAKYRNVVFTATAGAGKSMLMRYLYLRFLSTQSERLPIFVELKDINPAPNTSLLSFITSRVADYIEGFSEQQTKYAFEKGAFVLFLDGFDEINHDVRKEREAELNQISGRYENLWIFVSSRPAEGFAAWEKFHIFTVQPFTQKQVELLLSKIPYDDEIKGIFRKKLSEGLYDTHKEFLTNPLLTIMMLITLEQFAEVPAKIHLFYEYAFEALFGRHDVTKGGFQRKRHTSLALDDFKRLFSYFCMITYAKKVINFSSDDTLNYIQQSIVSSQITVDKSQFRNDLTESTCMLVLDGLDYTFSHRSFQEYFAAYFLARVKVDDIQRALPKLVDINGPYDNVIKMLAEMNNEKFEEAWALPEFKRLEKAGKGIDAKKFPVAFCRAVLGDPVFNISPNGICRVLIQPTSEKQAIRYTLYSVYEVFSKIHARIRTREEMDKEFIAKVESGQLLGDDPRFEKIRRVASAPVEKKAAVDVKLVDADDDWFSETYFGKFLGEEAKILPEQTQLLANRVAARKKGLDTIFS